MHAALDADNTHHGHMPPIFRVSRYVMSSAPPTTGDATATCTTIGDAQATSCTTGETPPPLFIDGVVIKRDHRGIL